MKSTTFNAAIIFLCTFFFSHFSFAQSSFFVGPMATGHLSNQEVSRDFADFDLLATDGYDLFFYPQDVQTKSLLGLSGGVSFGFQFGKFSLVSGARFYQKGARQESRSFDILEETDLPDLYIYDPAYGYGPVDLGTFKLTERQNFIYIPLLARYQFFGDDFGVTLSLGPAFNIGIGNAKSDWEAVGQVVGKSIDGTKERTYGKDIIDMYKPMQTSFVISPGVVFPVGEQGKLHFNIYWENDLSSSLNDNFRDQVNIDGEIFLRNLDGDKRNKSFGIGISYEHHLDFNIGSHH
jgi:hypothetical protein